jgi:hypothetical protein
MDDKIKAHRDEARAKRSKPFLEKILEKAKYI